MALTQGQLAQYQAAAQRRQQQQGDRLRQRQQLGWAVARQASELLKRRFGVRKVVLFGSMRSLTHIHERSDVDLAVWGLNPQDYFRAVGELLAIHPAMPVDLVEAESAPTRILQAIETTGVVL